MTSSNFPRNMQHVDYLSRLWTNVGGTHKFAKQHEINEVGITTIYKKVIDNKCFHARFDHIKRTPIQLLEF